MMFYLYGNDFNIFLSIIITPIHSIYLYNLQFKLRKIIELIKIRPPNQGVKGKMKIQTFEKIQQRLIDLTLLPVSFFIAIAIYFWQSLWDQHIFITMVAFVASSASCVYFLSVNISTKPYTFLRQTYLNNKKYKTLRKIQQKKSDQNPKDIVTSTAQEPQKQIGVQDKTSKHKKGHFQFHLEEQKETQKPLEFLNQSQKQKNQRVFPSFKEKDAQKMQTFVKGPSRFSNELDPLEMFFYLSKPNSLQRDKKLYQKIDSDILMVKSVSDQQFEIESKEVKKCIQNFTKDVESQDIDRSQYEQRYKSYKKSLQVLEMNSSGMQRLVDETKMIIRQKIEQNLKKQYENLDNIQSTLRKNFNVNFKSYSERIDINPTILSSAPSRKDYLGHHQPLTFSFVLQQCVNLLRHHYFSFQFIGESSRIDQVKSEIKTLINERIMLDQYLFLKKPLKVGRLEAKEEVKGVSGEFGEERYLSLMKLRNLAQILGEKKIAQQNLLKEFFSTPRTFLAHSNNDPTTQINDSRNIQFIIHFMIQIFQQKLTRANASDYIQIRLTKPNFEDRTVNFIWITKALGLKSHYDIEYSYQAKDGIQRKLVQRGDEVKEGQGRRKYITCCPGQSNVWVCIAFIRQIIAKIGIRKQKYPMIKDQTLKKDFQRLIELLE